MDIHPLQATDDKLSLLFLLSINVLCSCFVYIFPVDVVSGFNTESSSNSNELLTGHVLPREKKNKKQQFTYYKIVNFQIIYPYEHNITYSII